MRILHIYKDYYPVLGGIENHLRALAEGLAARGHDVTVLVANPDAHTVIQTINGVCVVKAGRWATLASTPVGPTMLRQMRRLPVDIAHLHFPYPFGDLAYTLLGRAQRTVITYHSDIVRQKNLLRVYAPWLRHTLNRADRIIATSPRYVNTSPYLAPRAQKCSVIPYGIDVARFMNADPDQVQRIRAQYGTPLILFVGQLRYYKGVEFLIRAMTHVPGHALLIGGETTTRRVELENIARELGVADRVILLGEKDTERPAFYHACDVFVLPSIERSEAFGIVQLEAMAASRPVISTEVGTGTSWVNLDGQTGLVVPPRDVEALAGAINALLSDDARQRVTTEFTVETMLDRTEAVYQSLIEH